MRSTMDQPQKLIPKTEGKQMTSHSYSTRSKAKRASLICDDDSSGSGSQVHQPPLKRRTGPGAKQACKSGEINNNDGTPGSKSVDTNTVGENTAAEIALTNDLVLESLVRYMNRSDLLSCRIVNKQWQYEATKELRRRKLVIKFFFQCQENEASRDKVFQDICRRLRQCETPSLLSSFQVKTDACNDLGSTGMRSFFTTVGYQLNHLTLHLDYCSNTLSFERSSLFTHLQNLLCHQAPNLEFLKIISDLPYHWEDELEALDSPDLHQNDNNEFGLLPNLKTFIVDGSPPLKFVTDVINAAVNLRSLGGAWTTCIKYLMGAEGRAKIHQLKSLLLAVHSMFFRNRLGLEVLETFLMEHRQSLQLETFECVHESIHGNASSELRIVGVINHILEYSSESLLKLKIEPTKGFENILNIPRLPKLQEICFHCFWSSHFELSNGGFFPRGFNMNHSFPSVSSIVLLRCTVSFFRLFVRRMKVEMTEPVPSIRRITVIDKEMKGNIDPPLATVTDFSYVFPNLVSISYVDSDEYYKI